MIRFKYILYMTLIFNLSAYAASIDAEIIKDIDFFEMMSILDDEETMGIDFENLNLEDQVMEDKLNENK